MGQQRSVLAREPASALLPMIPRKRWDEILSFSVNLVDLSLCVNLRELNAGSFNVRNGMTQLKRLSISVRGRNAYSPLRIEYLLPVVARLDDLELLDDWNGQDDDDKWCLQLQKYVMVPFRRTVVETSQANQMSTVGTCQATQRTKADAVASGTS